MQAATKVKKKKKLSYRLGVRDAVGGVASVCCRDIALAKGRVVLGSHLKRKRERGTRRKKER